MEQTARNEQKERRVGDAFSAKKLAFIGMFGAAAAVLMFLEFPLPFAPSFYKLDFSEVPVMIGAFALGPVAGFFIELIKILIKFIMKGTQTAGIGEIANFVIGISFVLPDSIYYRAGKTKKRAAIGLVIGGATMVIAGCLINALVLLPAYSAAYGIPLDSLIAMGSAINASVTDVFTFVIICVAPFNLFKAAVVSVITFLLYKRISSLIRMAGV